MKKKIVFAGFILSLLIVGVTANAQQSLWFGTVKTEGKTNQGRFEVVIDTVIKSIVYAPYGISPTTFKDVKQHKNQLTFTWQLYQSTYQCLLLRQDSSAYMGSCITTEKQPIQVIIRQFTKADAILQGDSLLASPKDVEILERALSLLNNGSNWNRADNRVCDGASYPYKWSLFCALHQASIDVDSEYKHLRPAIQAARQAINEVSKGKQYAHLLQDFNNEAQSFSTIAEVLTRAKVIIVEKMNLHQ